MPFILISSADWKALNSKVTTLDNYVRGKIMTIETDLNTISANLATLSTVLDNIKADEAKQGGQIADLQAQLAALQAGGTNIPQAIIDQVALIATTSSGILATAQGIDAAVV